MKYSGIIGIVELTEQEPGVWADSDPEEISVKGDVKSYRLSSTATDSINTNHKIRNEISIVVPRAIFEKYDQIRYCSFRGTNWEVDTIKTQYPRLVLTLGEVYHNG